MKAIKTLVLFTFSILVTGCFDAPEFGDVPRIEYKSIYFGQAANPALQQDSLVVELTFEDGDGDLGLGDEHRNAPFHEYDLFLHNGASITSSVRNVYGENSGQGAFVIIPEGVAGKLVRPGDLPDLPADNCNDYKMVDFLLHQIDNHVFDASYDGGLYDIDTITTQPPHFRLSGKFLVEQNRFNKNIFVTFYRNLTPDNPNTFEEYVWQCQTFDGRFETLSDEPAPLSGTLRYSMRSLGFAAIMGNESVTWKLKFTIVDRQLRESNEVFTQAFTLREITRS